MQRILEFVEAHDLAYRGVFEPHAEWEDERGVVDECVVVGVCRCRHGRRRRQPVVVLTAGTIDACCRSFSRPSIIS
jgi:hypothetical protein